MCLDMTVYNFLRVIVCCVMLITETVTDFTVVVSSSVGLLSAWKQMVENISANALLLQQMRVNVILVQFFVFLFLCINSMMIVTFFTRPYFYTNMRYILFATTLLSHVSCDKCFAYLHPFKNTYALFYLCYYILTSLYTFVTPVSLTAMTLERYVAICMPLRHAQLCSKHRALQCILIIHGISLVPCVLILSSIFALATHDTFKQFKMCIVTELTKHTEQSNLRAGINQTYFLILFVVIIFCYVTILKVAKAASGDNKKSTLKGLRTVVLHGVQLLLCLTQMWRPFIEDAVFKTNIEVYLGVRFANYILFYLFPRCLSPLIYGLRDEKFALALKHNALCYFHKNKSFDLTR